MAPTTKFVGPFGGDGGNPWDDESRYTGVQGINLTHKGGVGSFNIVYDLNGVDNEIQHPNGDPNYNPGHANFNFPEERITQVSGYTGIVPDATTTPVVRSIKFITNKNIYGPFGVEEGAPFNVQIPAGAHISGFRGRTRNDYLIAIGIYITKP